MLYIYLSWLNLIGHYICSCSKILKIKLAEISYSKKERKKSFSNSIFGNTETFKIYINLSFRKGIKMFKEIFKTARVKAQKCKAFFFFLVRNFCHKKVHELEFKLDQIHMTM